MDTKRHVAGPGSRIPCEGLLYLWVRLRWISTYHQGSALSPLLYALFTSDIPRDLPATVKLAQFADDTALFATDPKKSNIASRLQKALHLLGKWFRLWRIEVNPEKSAAVLFTGKRSTPQPPSGPKHVLDDPDDKITTDNVSQQRIHATNTASSPAKTSAPIPDAPSQINVEPSRGPSPRRRHPRFEVSHSPPDVVEPWGSSHGELSRSPHSPGDAVATPQVVSGK
ncbi:jg20829 [Pararge aegeria aegeria]|uniref:Jg20829 protein n=1 Tax=Pararge aegeria aegeria TaxID=348720 RepID=A0A8S4R5R7_9NEOP|nr:jg20829 [Pararge aegeria aegeria]